MHKITHGSTCSGIGGGELAALAVGWQNMFHCEKNLFSKKVLDYHFPESDSYEDLTTTDFTRYRNRIDVYSAGFPCQPFSTAGNRRGSADERHIWSHILRTVDEIKPTVFVGENVPGILSIEGGVVFEQACVDLELKGYEVWPVLLPAASIGAPHLRNRLWIIAYSASNRRQRERPCSQNENRQPGSKYTRIMAGRFEGLGVYGTFADSTSPGLERYRREKPSYKESSACHQQDYWQNFPTQSPVCSGGNGFSTELDGITFSKWRNESIKAYGNAWVPQVAIEIFKSIDNLLKEATK